MERVPVDAVAPSSVALTEDAVWVMSRSDNLVVRLDADTHSVEARIPVGRNPIVGGTAHDGSVWVPNQGDSTVSRIDPATNRVTGTYKGGLGAVMVNEAFGDLWVTAFQGTTITRFDPDRAQP